MAGIFGARQSRDGAYAAAGIPEASTGAKLLNLIGANLLGVDVLGDRRREQLGSAQDDFLKLLAQSTLPQSQTIPGAPTMKGPGLDGAPIGPAQAPPQTVQTPGLNINSPQMAGVVIQAQRLGVPVTQVLDVLKAQQPNVQYDRGQGYDQKTGKPMGAFHVDTDKGQIPLYGPDGRFEGIKNADGSVQAAAEMAGAVKGAQAAAEAPYQPVQTFGPGGAPRTITAAQLAAGQGGTGQSPAQTAADTARATAGATADVNLPQTLSTANQAIGLIEQMKTHPGLNSRTGWRGMIPALPDTPGADFSAMQDQLKGKIFLQAYGDLRGGGSITEVEGRKATDALARLSNTQTKEGYLSALNDLESVINTGASRAAQNAQRLQPNAGGTGPVSKPSSGRVSTPQPGQVVKGYRFLGGDPASPNSWAKN